MFKTIIPTLRVKDSRRTQSLFQKIGFSSIWEHQDDDSAPRFVEMHRDQLSLFISEHAGDGPVGIQLYFLVDDVDPIFELLKNEEVEIIVEPYDAEWGQRVFEIMDYDGNLLRFGANVA